MVDVLVILDGASEPLPGGGAPTSLERARTPALDRLVRAGVATRLRTVAPWLKPGSEVAIPALLGWTPGEPVDRGAVEAAAYEIAVPAGSRAWRVDVLAAPARRAGTGTSPRSAAGEPGGRAGTGTSLGSAAGEPGGRACASDVGCAAAVLQAAAPRHVVHRLAGHRLLVVGRVPLPCGALAGDLRVWPEGVVPPSILGPDTVVVGARGAAIGVARLMGAATVVPPGATGLPSSDLVAKAVAAARAIEAGATRVVVHVGGPDEAAHRRDPAAKVASIERADRELVAPLARAVARAGGTLAVCPDHGCDPATGEHDAAPVPNVTWSHALHHGLERVPASSRATRLTERAVMHLPVVAPRARHAGVAA